MGSDEKEYLEVELYDRLWYFVLDVAGQHLAENPLDGFVDETEADSHSRLQTKLGNKHPRARRGDVVPSAKVGKGERGLKSKTIRFKK